MNIDYIVNNECAINYIDSHGKERSIVKSTAQTIIDCNIDIPLDITEIKIDNLFDADIIKELPIIKYFYNIVKNKSKQLPIIYRLLSSEVVKLKQTVL